MKLPKTYKLGELFCGPGGMAVASTYFSESLKHVWGVDFAPYAIETFNANLGNCGICMDARQFVAEELTEERRIDALAFGFPCNSFSMVGKQQGMSNEKFGKLYQTGIAVIERYDPIWFVAENVSGIKAVKGGDEFDTILHDLANAGKGYDVTAHLYKFEEYGVPQARHRYVIVGLRHDIAAKNNIEFRVPAPTHGPGRASPYVTCKAAIEALGPQSGGMLSERVKDRLKFIAPGDNAWKLDELLKIDDAQLETYLKALPWYEKDISEMGKLEDIRAKIEACKLKCKAARMSHIYKRLDPSRPAYTLTGSGGGGTHLYHWSEHRSLNNAERAALQSFPADFKFFGTAEQVRKQIGMAVPTLGARQIFSAILKSLNKEPYDSVPADIVILPRDK